MPSPSPSPQSSRDHRSQVVLSYPQTVWKPTCLFSHLESPALLRLTSKPIIITIWLQRQASPCSAGQGWLLSYLEQPNVRLHPSPLLSLQTVLSPWRSTSQLPFKIYLILSWPSLPPKLSKHGWGIYSMGIVALECSPAIRDYSPASVTFYFLHWTEQQCPPHTQKMDKPARSESWGLFNPEPNQEWIASQSRSSLTGLPTRKEHQGSCTVHSWTCLTDHGTSI